MDLGLGKVTWLLLWGHMGRTHVCVCVCVCVVQLPEREVGPEAGRGNGEK